MTGDQSSFEAGRDIRGAFAPAPGASARNIEAGIYIERYVGPGIAAPSAGPIFYNLPSLPLQYQARTEDVSANRDKLLAGNTPVGIASTTRPFGLHGMGGIGKTVLATALVHDPAVREAYPDGVAWLTFGRDLSVLAKPAELAFALTRRETSFANVDEARGRLSLLTQEKRLLIVLDDVWEPGAVDAFTSLGPGCRLLITTRDNGVLIRAAADCHELNLLSSSAAKEFLAVAAGTSISELPSEADDLVKECGRLPLALASVAALIRSHTYSWSDALAALQEAALEEFQDRHDRTLATVLKLSVDSLSDRTRAAFLDCAAFHEDVAIPEATLLRLWSDRTSERAAKRLAQELVERCLLNRDDKVAADGRPQYRIHDLYLDYLHRAAAPLSTRHEHLIERYSAACPNGWSNGPDDGYFIQHLPWHLREANKTEILRSLLFDVFWLRRKLSIAGVVALIRDCHLVLNDPEVTQLGAALELSMEVLRRHPEELKTQLSGRLIPEDGPKIAELLKILGEDRDCIFNPVRHGYLIRPGALLRSVLTGAGVNAIMPLADGKRVLSGSEDNAVCLWDLDTGTELRRFNGHDLAVTAIAVLPGGKRVLSGSEDNSLRLWDLNAGAQLRCFEGHEGSVRSIALLPDGKRALSSSSDKTLRLWDLDTGAQLRRFEGHDGSVRSIALLPDGKRALSSSTDKTLRIWDLDTGTELRRVEGHDKAVTAIAVLPDGRRVLSSSFDKTLRLWDLDTGAELRRFDGHDNGVRAIALLPDGRHALSGSWDRTLRLWDLDTGVELRRFDGHENAVRAIALMPGGKRALSGSEDKTLRLWNITGIAHRRFDGHDDSVRTIALMPDDKRALSGSADRTLRLWDLSTGAELRRFAGHARGIQALALLPDGKRALSGSSDRTLRLWDLDTGAELCRFKGHDSRVTSIALLPDGKRALSGSNDNTLRLWDLDTGTELSVFRGHAQGVTAVTLLSDGNRALSSSLDKTLRLWDLVAGAELRRFGHDAAISAVALLPGDEYALAGFADGTLRLWDLDTGAELRRFDGHGDVVTSIALLPDAKRVLSGSHDSTLRLWDLNTGAELASFMSDGTIVVVTVSRDGYRLVVGDSTGRVIPLGIRS